MQVDGANAHLSYLARDGVALCTSLEFEPVPQVLKNVRFSGGKPLDNPLVKAAIEDARSRLGTSGRLVIRPSGTEPLIRVMAEADDPSLVEAVVDEIVGVIADVKSAA